ncbi:MAG: hypothetical protein Q7U39_14985 [Nitrospira sp.]|nr:hypothetical protein [Nitrospira sp.]
MLTTSQEASAPWVTDLLREDHKKVKSLLEAFEQARDATAKQRIVGEALAELDVQAKREEEIQEDDLIEQALDDYHVVHILIGELKKMKTSDDRYGAQFTGVADNVTHNMKAEKPEMFPKDEVWKIDWEALSSRVEKRKEQLMAKSGATSKNARTRPPRKNSAIPAPSKEQLKAQV